MTPEVCATFYDCNLASYIDEAPAAHRPASPTNTTDRFDNARRYRDGAHPNQRQLTPPYVLGPVRDALGGVIGLDPCTEPDNPTMARAFDTAADDGLVLPWCVRDWFPTVYVNPPYSKAKEPWVRKCIEAGARGQKVVLLIPAHTDTRIFHDAMQTASAVCFIKGRVKFGVLRPADRFGDTRQEAASHPSVLIGWNVDLAPCAVLGRVVPLSSPDTIGSAEGTEQRHLGAEVDG